jgi:hypothetical protein
MPVAIPVSIPVSALSPKLVAEIKSVSPPS